MKMGVKMQKKFLLKKTVLLIMCTIMTILSCVDSYAEALWEQDGSFLRNMQLNGKAVAEDRNYIASSGTGSVIVYVSPENLEQLAALQNDTKIYVGYIYTDDAGVKWGAMEYENGKSGWVKMDECRLYYDSLAFEKEHGSEYRAYGGELDEYISQNGYANIAIWLYPNAQSALYKLSGTEDKNQMYISQIYMDQNGKEWAYLSAADGWIYVDSPTVTNPNEFEKASETVAVIETESTTELPATTEAATEATTEEMTATAETTTVEQSTTVVTTTAEESTTVNDINISSSKVSKTRSDSFNRGDYTMVIVVLAISGVVLAGLIINRFLSGKK